MTNGIYWAHCSGNELVNGVYSQLGLHFEQLNALEGDSFGQRLIFNGKLNTPEAELQTINGSILVLAGEQIVYEGMLVAAHRSGYSDPDLQLGVWS